MQLHAGTDKPIGPRVPPRLPRRSSASQGTTTWASNQWLLLLLQSVPYELDIHAFLALHRRDLSSVGESRGTDFIDGSETDFLWLPVAALSERALPAGGPYVRYFRGVQLHALCASSVFSRPPQSREPAARVAGIKPAL